MKYEKTLLLFSEQVELLLKRGLEGDPKLMEERLSSVNYYRLTGYLYPYRKPGADNYQLGTKFETVWDHYAFDRRLRLLVMDAIERIEIAVRTQLAYHHAQIYKDPFAYALLPSSIPALQASSYHDLLSRIRDETVRSADDFVSHFRTKYGAEHEFLPIWMAVEIMSFGATQRFYRGASHQVKQQVATHFGMPSRVLDSWLHALSVIRNICAHHGRLWNKELGVKPLIPYSDHYPDWHTPVQISNNRVFCILTLCRYCLSRIAPQSRWPNHVHQLLADFPAVSIKQMGFPSNWVNSPLWK
jgi:abortive infection bacteriophage resistance protein